MSLADSTRQRAPTNERMSERMNGSGATNERLWDADGRICSTIATIAVFICGPTVSASVSYSWISTPRSPSPLSSEVPVPYLRKSSSPSFRRHHHSRGSFLPLHFNVLERYAHVHTRTYVEAVRSQDKTYKTRVAVQEK